MIDVRALLRALAFVLAALAAAGPSTAAAQCQEGTDTLIARLAESESFRVRVLAANALGSRLPCVPITTALVAALRDPVEAVRAAAASSLGRVGDASALSALRGMSSDGETAVRDAARDAIAAIEGRSGGGSSGGSAGGGGSGGGPARYYVALGPGAGLSGAAMTTARRSMRTTMDAASGVELAPDGESASAANRVLRERSLAGFFLDWTVTIEDSSAGLQIRVAIVLQDYPGRDLRGMPHGSATLAGVHDASRAGPGIEQAIASAVRSAVTTMAGSRGGSGR